MKFGLNRNLIIFIAVLTVAIALFSYFAPQANEPEEISLDETIVMSQNGKIAKIVVAGEELLITSTTDAELKTTIGSLTLVDLQELGLNLEGVDWEVKPSGINWGNLALNFLPLMIFGGLLFFLFRRAQGANSQALNFGRSRARLFDAQTPTVTFDDVAGVDEAKQEVHEVVEFLKSREKFQRLGARIPRGLLLIGPPGTGKTLLARAIAGEAGVPFFSISGSEFVEMFVGVGASRVRDLFEQAKRNAPCLIFIDEIDAVGRHRGAGLGGGHDEREQTLNQILTEMDGFDTNTSVIVLAATNRPDILDPALLRPGRFDRRVVLDRPDIIGRAAILKVHANGKPLDKSVDLEVLAKQTAGFSGADLANLVNEAAILAARRGKDAISMQELEESIDRVIAGPERKSRRISTKEKEITAYHEAGHALVAKMLPNADPVHKISIVARGLSLGHTRQLPTEDRYLMTRSQFNDMLATLLAGHTAEKLIFNEMTTGGADDIERATMIARKMATDYGMSDKLGPRTFGHKEEMVFLGREITEQRNYSEKIAQTIDEEVHKLIEHASQTATKILNEHKDKLIKIAQELIAKETLEGDELEAILSDTPPPSAKTAAESAHAPAKTKAKSKAVPKEAPPLPESPPETSPGYGLIS
ncbi:MAG: ATP-dependent zinc metalloprotease FtsH [Dehalococcoidales bacterium]|nr:ATP-dependent zinc metalloprotease FtsH [Dehalococcoidales bacterium]